MAKYQALTGMKDILPAQTVVWQRVESVIANLLNQYAYSEIRLPIVEATALFKRSIGDVTDIVEKEMYTFEDLDGSSISLRPEGTASCVRAGIERGLLYNQIQRLWYSGPMFRHEKPQEGRYRQFYQVGIEAFGLSGPDVDVEQMALTQRLWRELGISDYLTLEINSIGAKEDRQRFKDDLVAFLKQHEQDLDEDSQRRLNTNPMRILDSKVSTTQALLADAPELSHYLSQESQQLYMGLKLQLDHLGIAYRENPKLVRGLDYYNDTVFEWVTSELGAQGTVCAGGRYDKLVEYLGGKETPAMGCAIGLDRLMLLVAKTQVSEQPSPFVYVTSVGDVSHYSLLVAEKIRDQLPGASVISHCAGGNFKSQMKKADKSMAEIAVLIGENEMANQQATIKCLRTGQEQQTLSLDQAIAAIEQQWQLNHGES